MTLIKFKHIILYIFIYVNDKKNINSNDWIMKLMQKINWNEKNDQIFFLI